MSEIILPQSSYTYVYSGDPTITTNPELIGASWLNITTGNVFHCMDNTVDANVWRGKYWIEPMPTDPYYLQGPYSGGQATDISGNARHITVASGGAYSKTAPNGDTLYGCTLAGANQTTGMGSKTFSGGFTVSFWYLQTSTFTDLERWFAIHTWASAGAMLLYTLNGTQFQFGTALDSDYQPPASGQVSKVWLTHVCLSRAETLTTYDCYINGKLIAQGTGRTTTALSGIVTIGDSANGPEGYMLDLNIYDKALTAAEVKALFHKLNTTVD